MKFNVDCARDVLLAIEEMDFEQVLYFKSLITKLPNYSEDELAYTCLKLAEANFLNIVTKKLNTSALVVRINDITYEGHQFLANIRSNSVWEKIKSKAVALGSVSVPVLQQLAADYFSKLIK